MSNIAIIDSRPKSITIAMADKFGMEAPAFEATVRATCMKPDRNGRIPSKEEFAAFLLVAKQYDLNPLTKEIHAFAQKGGGIVPIVSVDGWIKLINSHPQFDGMELTDINDEKGDLIAVTCSLWRKDRSRPMTLTEYLKECIRDTEPWKMKHRMLRHKALIQAARYAFGFAGIYDQDEGERIIEAVDVTPTIPTPPAPPSAIATVADQPKNEAHGPEYTGKIAQGPTRAERGEFADKNGVPIPSDALADFDAFHRALDSCPTLESLNAMFETLTKNMHKPEDIEEAQDRLNEVASKFPMDGDE